MQDIETQFPPSRSSRENAIVLVHGAWVGEWSWLPVLPQLVASGRSVYAVSLKGHGARRHESGPHVTLADHVADVLGVLETFDLAEVTLVGHSYGGRVITLAWQGAADRIARLVYLDAHAPVAPDVGQSPERDAKAAANGGMLPFGDYAPDPSEFGGDMGVAWFLERVVPQSYATISEPFSTQLPDDLPKTYVHARSNGPSRFSGYAAAARAHPAWDYRELKSSHWLMFARPSETVDIILECAARDKP